MAFRTVKRTALADSIKHLLQGSLGRAFVAWRDNIAQRAALKQKATACLARFVHAHTAQAFSAWLDWAALQKEHRSGQQEPECPCPCMPGFFAQDAAEHILGSLAKSPLAGLGQ